MKRAGDTSMAQTLHRLDGRFIAFLFLTYSEEPRVFRNKGEIIQFNGATEILYISETLTIDEFLALSGNKMV
jgi:hypothetical protein